MNARAGCALALASALAACADPAASAVDATVDATPYQVSLAALRPDGYEVLAGDAGIEMRLGFQGFRYTRVVLVATGTVPAASPGVFHFAIEGFDPAEQRVNAVAFHERNPGVFVSEPEMVFANDVALERVVGHVGTLTVTLDDRAHHAVGTYAGVLRWDPTCIEGADGVCLARDGGTP